MYVVSLSTMVVKYKQGRAHLDILGISSLGVLDGSVDSVKPKGVFYWPNFFNTPVVSFLKGALKLMRYRIEHGLKSVKSVKTREAG